MPTDDNNPFHALGKYAYLAALLPVSTLIGYAIGYFLDKAFHTNFLYIVFLILGVVAGFIDLIRVLSRDTGQ